MRVFLAGRVDSLLPASANLTEIDQTVQLTTTVYDQNNSVISGANVTWSSSDTEVASVSVQGLVTVLKNGASQRLQRDREARRALQPLPCRRPFPTAHWKLWA